MAPANTPVMRAVEVGVVDAPAVVTFLVGWLKQQVEASKTEGVVFGLSGGIDSAVVGALCKQAVPERCQGLIMPCHSDPRDREDALAVARLFGIPVQTVDLSPVYDLHLAALRQSLAAAEQEQGPGLAVDRRASLAEANLKPRLRMATLYFFANSLNYLVVGTGNRSELTVGYFTKYGDGGVDLLPLGSLVKTQVRQLAEHLGLPRRVIDKPPSAGLWEGQTDEGEMGTSYAELDRYILEGVAAGAVRAKVERMSRAAAHKLTLPLIPELPEEFL
ncbi:MAG: NAD(+) synthase [Bacillota bacterium]|nr:NAD(+) synthase [Bacillota bacterium]